MANKVNCFDKTALIFAGLVKSSCERYLDPSSEEAGEVSITAKINLESGLDDVEKIKKFSFDFVLDVDGLIPNGDERAFRVSCSVLAQYIVTGDEVVTRPGITADMKKYVKQIYPIARNYAVNQLSHMGINASQTPWDVFLHVESINRASSIEEKSVTEKKPRIVKKAAAKKRAAPKKKAAKKKTTA